MNKKMWPFVILGIICAVGLLFSSLFIKLKEDAENRDYIVVEDFEYYIDDEPHAIWNIWSDGFKNDENGITIGHITVPYMEIDIVHGGHQSAPIYYDSTDGNYAEATINTNDLPIGKDWTAYSSDTLTLWFHGHSINSPSLMYVKLNDSKIYYTGNLEDLKKSKWMRWDIDLLKFGIDLTNVSTMSIGFDKTDKYTNGQGVVFIDDISLYQNSSLQL